MAANQPGFDDTDLSTFNFSLLHSLPMTQLSDGFAYFLQGFRLICRPGVRAYAFAPILINVLVFSVLLWWGINEFEQLMDWLLPSTDAWWINWLRPVLWLLFAVVVALIWFFTFTVVANLIGAPFNGLLAEQIEAHLTGKTSSDAGFYAIFKDIGPLLWNELRKIMYAAMWIIPALILFLIPGINLVAPFIWLLLMAWLMALQYVDFPMGNHGLRFKTVRTALDKQRSAAFGFGLGVLGAAMIPGINLIVMPAAVAGATAFWVERIRDTSGK